MKTNLLVDGLIPRGNKVSVQFSSLSVCLCLCLCLCPCLIESLIEPLFDYCDVVWGKFNKTLTTRLQNRAARIIRRKGYDVRSTTIRGELRWDDLETTRRKHIAILMYKIVNISAPGYLSSIFSKKEQRLFTSRE